MSKTTLTMGRDFPVESSLTAKLGAAFAKALERLIAANEARADRMVRPYLARMPIDDLQALGFTPREIADIKADRHSPVVRWV